jgi:putative lipoprotein
MNRRQIVAGLTLSLTPGGSLARDTVGFSSPTKRSAPIKKSEDEAEANVAQVKRSDNARQPPSPVGRWLAEDIGGRGVIDRVQTVLEIDAGGVVTGSGGCNRIHGTATIAGERITFGQIASTRMACPPAVMDQESKFLLALRDTRSFQLDLQRHKLILFDAAGTAISRLSTM